MHDVNVASVQKELGLEIKSDGSEHDFLAFKGASVGHVCIAAHNASPLVIDIIVTSLAYGTCVGVQLTYVAT
jgi:hypothetical protein